MRTAKGEGMKPLGNHKGWGNGLIDWIEGNTAFISCVFSWQLQQAYQKAVWYRQMGKSVQVGGPAVKCRPHLFNGVASVSGDIDALPRHNPNATRSTKGCPRNCPFCIVRLIEPTFEELPHYVPRPIVCDNNFLACSKRHFDNVVDSLKPLKQVDFNQGLDIRYMDSYRISRLCELDLKWLRVAWDNVNEEMAFRDGVQTVTRCFPASRIIVYVLMGFCDTPDDALYRLQTIRSLGLKAFPMRYQPWDATRKNSYVAPNWTHRELRRYMIYWSRMYLSAIPFEEFVLGGH